MKIRGVAGTVGVLAVALVAGEGFAARAQVARPACAPGTALAPQLSFDQKDPRAAAPVATHTVVAEVAFPLGGAFEADESSVQWTAPSGVPVTARGGRGADVLGINAETRIGVTPAGAGPLPVKVTWVQENFDAKTSCTASATTTLQVRAAKPLRFAKPHAKHSPELELVNASLAASDLRPLTIRVRSSGGGHFPSRRVRFRSTTLVLRPVDPGYVEAVKRVRKTKYVDLEASYEAGTSTRAVTILVRTHPQRVKRYLGYELQVSQAGHLVARVRAAGNCSPVFCGYGRVRINR